MIRAKRLVWDLGLIAPAVLIQAAACASTPRPVRLLVEVAPFQRANDNSPIPVSFVAVRNAKFLQEVDSMSAKEWFEKRVQFRRDDPSGELFTEWMWEFVPGYTPKRMVIETEGDTLASLVFANYRTESDHRVKVGRMRKLRIELDEQEVSVLPLETVQGP